MLLLLFFGFQTITINKLVLFIFVEVTVYI